MNVFTPTLAQIKALTATVQKVSEKLEVNKPAPELAANSR